MFEFTNDFADFKARILRSNVKIETHKKTIETVKNFLNERIAGFIPSPKETRTRWSGYRVPNACVDITVNEHIAVLVACSIPDRDLLSIVG